MGIMRTLGAGVASTLLAGTVTIVFAAPPASAAPKTYNCTWTDSSGQTNFAFGVSKKFAQELNRQHGKGTCTANPK